MFRKANKIDKMTEPQIERYRRQIMLPEVGLDGQEKVNKGKILVIGTGGLGSPALFYLAAAGVGTIGLMDDDTVNLSNLNRQILHLTRDIDRMKTESAAEKLSLLNPDVKLEIYPFRLTAENGAEIIADYDFIIDATDNTKSKYLINDLCVKGEKAFSHGAICEMRGHTFTYRPGSPCCRCLFGVDNALEDINNSVPVGVLGTIAGIIGAIQATEAIKYLTGIGDLLTGRLMRFDSLTMTAETIKFSQRSHCVCHK